MHELETLLSRLKMEHLGYHVESLLEQAAKKELNYREFLCMALQQEWNGRHQRGILVTPAVVSGAADITGEIQSAVAQKMAAGGGQ